MKNTILFCLFAMLITSIQAQKTPTIDNLLKPAYQQAKKENKKILVLFHASWCSWCHKMDEAINDPACKPFFDANYVLVHVVTGEHQADKKKLNTVGAEDFLAARRGKDVGLPYWLFLDAKGKVLEDAHLHQDKSSNLGCPAADEEVASFVEKLKNTSKLTAEELEIIAERFKKNNPNR